MRYTKANFRALREACGLTQQDIADHAKVNIKSVKRWEREDHNAQPREDVFNWLVSMYDHMIDKAADFCDAIFDKAESAVGLSDERIAIRYYRTQDQLDQERIKAGLEPDLILNYANAQSRLIAANLIDAGFEVEFYYPEHMELLEEDKITIE